MRKHISWIGVCLVTSALTILCVHCFNKSVTAMIENASVERKHRIIIDAGHGGVDGGATSCTGRLESTYNLEIAIRLNDLVHLLGYDTTMIRTTDVSVYTSGGTIAAKKISDLKERVRIVNEKFNSILVSIHQNNFPDSRYSGAVVLYAATNGSKEIAESMQRNFISSLNHGSKRQCKKADGIYLMEHIRCPGVLVECGFLSNIEEEEKLSSADYQQKLCCIIASSVCAYISEN